MNSMVAPAEQRESVECKLGANAEPRDIAGTSYQEGETCCLPSLSLANGVH